MDDFDDDVADVLAGVDAYGGAVVVGGVHRYGGVDCLQQAAGVDAGKDEAGVVEALGALGAGAYAHCREGVPYRGEEAAFFGQGATIADDGGCVHLQAVVVVEAQGLVAYHAAVELKAALLQALARAWVAAVEDGHVVAFGDGVDGSEQRQEVFLGVDVLLAVGAQQYIFAFLEPQAAVDVAGFDVGEVVV